jgi:dienelactone hydrolase
MIERNFDLVSHGETIHGVLWTPDNAARCPLVLAGHGYLQHKRALYPATLAADLIARGLCLAAIDAPHHGGRRPSDDPAAIATAWDEHWRTHGASRIASEHAAVIETLALLAEVDAGRIGYWGLSLATQYGIGLLVSQARIRAAALGMFSLADPGLLMRRYAPRVGCPVFFIRQLDDGIHPAERVRMLFDRIASPEKTLRSSRGGHNDVPSAVLDEAYEFLASKLTAEN